MIDKGRIKKAVREILEAVGEDPDREGLVRTPERVADMYEEIFAGLTADPADNLYATLQAIPALVGMPLPVARLCRNLAITPADGSTPQDLARTTGCIGLAGAV